MSDTELALPASLAARYAVLETLGAGAMGVVYRAVQITLDRPVALKLVRPEMLDADGRNRFLQEAKLAARINHPHVVHVYESGEEAGIPFIVFELVNGPSLRQLMEGAPLDPQVAVQYVRQVADGLAAAHEQGIIHRDVKPENVLVSKSGEAKIADFGISRPAQEDRPSLTATGTILGSPLYMSPEQAANRPLTAATDQYSLGVMLYELLTGAPPFNGSTGEILAQHLRDSIALPPGLRAELPSHVVEVLEQLVRKDPSRRFASMAEVAASLQKALARWRGPRKSTIPTPRPRVPGFSSTSSGTSHQLPAGPTLVEGEPPPEPESPRRSARNLSSPGPGTRPVTRAPRSDESFERQPLPFWAAATLAFLILASVGVIAYRAGQRRPPARANSRSTTVWPVGTIVGNVETKIYHVVGETRSQLPLRENSHVFSSTQQAEEYGYRRVRN